MSRHCIPLTRLAAGTICLLLGACGLGGPAHEPPSPAAAATVDMGFASFEPATVKIRVGDSIEWRNTAVITHTVTDDPKAAADPADAVLPAGGIAFDSGDIPAGEVYLHQFMMPGTYRYFCRHHEGDGMVATIVVEPAS